MKKKLNKCWVMTEKNKKYFNDNFNVEIINSDEATITYQRANYIEDGFQIVVTSYEFILFEIPSYGGEKQELCRENNINSIIDFVKKLY